MNNLLGKNCCSDTSRTTGNYGATARIAELSGTEDLHAKQLSPGENGGSALLPMSGIILCGGQSKRMGRNKSFLPYAGTTLIEHCLKLMSALFSEVFLVCNNPDDFEHLSASVVRDLIPNRGPLVGILSGLLVSNFEHSFVIACDMPLVGAQLIRDMSGQRYTADIVAFSRAGKVEPLLGVYATRCIEAIADRIFRGQDVAVDFVSESQPRLFEQDYSVHADFPCFNINTPADYGILCSMS